MISEVVNFVKSFDSKSIIVTSILVFMASYFLLSEVRIEPLEYDNKILVEQLCDERIKNDELQKELRAIERERNEQETLAMNQKLQNDYLLRQNNEYSKQILIYEESNKELLGQADILKRIDDLVNRKHSIDSNIAFIVKMNTENQNSTYIEQQRKLSDEIQEMILEYQDML